MEVKVGYCPVCDMNIEFYTNLDMCRCPHCGHDVAMYGEDDWRDDWCD